MRVASMYANQNERSTKRELLSRPVDQDLYGGGSLSANRVPVVGDEVIMQWFGVVAAQQSQSGGGEHGGRVVRTGECPHRRPAIEPEDRAELDSSSPVSRRVMSMVRNPAMPRAITPVAWAFRDCWQSSASAWLVRPCQMRRIIASSLSWVQYGSVLSL